MSGNGLVVYTAIYGDYDKIREPSIYCAGIAEYWMVTERSARLISPSWKRCVTPDYAEWDSLSDRMRSRLWKMHPHILFPTANITIWHGGNIQMNINPQQAVDEWLGDADLALFKHPHRNCVYEEAVTVLQMHKASALSITALLSLLEFNNYPKDNGLAACWFMIRRNNERMKAFNEAWWKFLVSSETERDQLLFNYTLWRMPDLDLRINYIPGNLLTSTHFKYHYH